MSITDYARSIVSDAVMDHDHNFHGITSDVLQDYCSERVYEVADSMCIYYSHCQEYINDLESGYADQTCDDGVEFAPSDWQQAMQAYAYQLVVAALHDEISDEIETAIEAIEEFNTEVERLGGDPDEATSYTSCLYGWEAHNYETFEGVMVWSDETDHRNGAFNPSLLEGEMYAVSHQIVDGIYLNWCATKEDLAA